MKASDNPEIFFVNGEVSKNCYNDYLFKQSEKTKTIHPGQQAQRDSEKFEEGIFNLTSRLDAFLISSQKEIAFLALGKVQSGKTAHMLGAIAWASDSQVALATIFTGVTEALNAQTTARLNKDLTMLGENYITIHEVPTSTESSSYQDFYDEVNKWVSNRLDKNLRQKVVTPLPVLVTLKNPSRVKTLKSLINSLQKEHGKQIISLLIDDEADQASQNAGANKRKITATYDAIKELRDLPNRNILLSYTATPQAVLLTERNGRLRPNYCVTVKPRFGYFGLEQAVSDDFLSNIYIVDDYDDKPSKWSSIPNSLKEALIQFIWTAWIRFYEQDIFYSQSGLNGDQLINELASVQMLIHESSRTIQHDAMFDHVSELKQVLTDGLKDALMGKLGNNQLKDLENEWVNVLDSMTKNLPSQLVNALRKDFDSEKIEQLFTLINHLKLLIVNSDPERSNSHINLPESNEEWNASRAWILIGGDILGRGLTIPQLTVTYFLRQAKIPNFDTVSQQMRFCGYRSRYTNFVFIHCQEHTFNLFKFMHEIDSTVWRRAEIWDETRLDILSTLPAVLYASRGGIKLEPVRKSVTDPDLIDQKITENVFSLRSIFDPNDFRLNLSTLNNFIQETKIKGIDRGSWIEFIDPSDSQFQRIIATWNTPDSRESALLIGAAELFNEEMGELGLVNIPKRIFVRKNLLNSIDSISDLNLFADSIDMTRRSNPKQAIHNLANWNRFFLNGMTISTKMPKWPSLAVSHIGDGQRKLRDELGEIASILIIEPTLALEKTRDRSSALAIGCAFTLMSPLEYDLRLIGHRI